jgi:hypothetical protein
MTLGGKKKNKMMYRGMQKVTFWYCAAALRLRVLGHLRHQTCGASSGPFRFNANMGQLVWLVTVQSVGLESFGNHQVTPVMNDKNYGIKQ